LQDEAESWFQAATADNGLSAVEIENLIQQRLAARQAKNWAESDRIRESLKQQGVLLEDAAGGTTWRRV
jgi:cysteinyl-tRNA synthetase